jgi:hypothetical protein
MKFKKSIATLGLAVALLGAVTPASAQTDYNGISVDSLEDTYANRYVEGATRVLAIKNNNSWVSTMEVQLQFSRDDRNGWVDIGMPRTYHFVGGEKKYIDYSNWGTFIYNDYGSWRYVVHTTKDDTGKDLGIIRDGFIRYEYRAMVAYDSSYGKWEYFRSYNDMMERKEYVEEFSYGLDGNPGRMFNITKIEY